MAAESVIDQTREATSGQREKLESTAQALLTVLVDTERSFLTILVDLKLTMAQAKAMLVLATNQQMTIGEFSAALGVRKSSGSALVDRLVEVGLVQRSEDATDRRYTRAELTGEGRQLFEGLRSARRERLLKGLSSLSDGDLDVLHQLLSSLADAMTSTS